MLVLKIIIQHEDGTIEVLECEQAMVAYSEPDEDQNEIVVTGRFSKEFAADVASVSHQLVEMYEEGVRQGTIRHQEMSGRPLN